MVKGGAGFPALAFLFFVDRGRTITGAAAQAAQRTEVKTISSARAAALAARSARPARQET